MKTRMQAKDIDERAVLAAAHSWQKWARQWMKPVPLVPPHVPGVLSVMVHQMGIPIKLAEYKLERMSNRDLLDYGTSVSFAWPTDKGLAMLFGEPAVGGDK